MDSERRSRPRIHLKENCLAGGKWVCQYFLVMYACSLVNRFFHVAMTLPAFDRFQGAANVIKCPVVNLDNQSLNSVSRRFSYAMQLTQSQLMKGDTSPQHGMSSFVLQSQLLRLAEIIWPARANNKLPRTSISKLQELVTHIQPSRIESRITYPAMSMSTTPHPCSDKFSDV